MAGQVMKLALVDEAFKTLLLNDPKAAITEAIDMTLPMSLEIRVYEDTPTVKHLILPVNPATEELSDLELEAVAGGAAKPEPPPGSSMYQVLLYQSTQGGPQAQAAKNVLSHVLKPSKPPFEFGY